MKLLEDVKFLLSQYGYRAIEDEYNKIELLKHDTPNYINALKKLKSKLLKVKEITRDDKKRVKIQVTHNKRGFQIYLIN